MINIIPIPAFKDNYIWLLVNSINHHCIIVDPGDALPVIDVIKQHNLILDAILITHHHNDHSGGIKQLIELYPVPVYGPAQEHITGVDHLLHEHDEIYFENLAMKFLIFDIPGHTKGHIAFYSTGMLFCGDTLFSAGCGRLFEGTAEQMFHSLSKITSLPTDTLIYCAHEYTLSNLRFAQCVEPNNIHINEAIALANQLGEQNLPTLPSVLYKELLMNPFLRCHADSVINSVNHHNGEQLSDPVNIFQALRTWKDTF
ncbi:MAG: hydroxyacylglutathione hydrolase [Gammaproteobacteria bacterium]|nr:hydroxyacylglutathione hydrolase [Gammaproteobacteria bacterium]